MAQINDAKKETLANLGYVYTAVDDAYKAYLQTESGLTEGTIQDLEKYLFEFLGYSGTLQNMWFEFLRDNGYTNTLQDMLHAFWNSDSAGLSPLYFSEFYAPLTHSAIPERAAAGTTSTFTRATTSTWPNNDGYLVRGVAGEIGFVGARRVRNLLTATQDYTSGDWLKVAATVSANEIAAPDGSLTADKVTFGSGSYLQHAATTVITGNTYVGGVWLKAGTMSVLTIQSYDGAYSFRGTVNLTTGVFTSTTEGVALDVEDGGNGWFRFSLRGVAAAAATVFYIVQTTDTGYFYAWGAQLEDVTAQTTQTAGEYVSVGVESAPYYHGSMVDGVKCYATDINGSPIPSSTLLGYQAQGARTNLCLQSNAFTTTWVASGTPAATQNVVGPDGATSAWTLTDNSADLEYVVQDITLTAAAHTASLFVKKTTGAQTAYPVITILSNVGTLFATCTIDTSNGIATAWTSQTARTAATGLTARCSSFNADFWRVEVSFTPTAVSWAVILIPAGTTSATYAGPTIDVAAQGSAVFYGAQVELGSYASSYIPTTTIAVARNADVLTYSSAGNVDGTKGWAYAEASVFVGATPSRLLTLNSATQVNALYAGGATVIAMYDGTAALNGPANSITADGIARKYVSTWNATGLKMRVAASGSLGAEGAFDGDMTPNEIRVGGLYLAGNEWNGTIRNVRIGQRQLSASELQAITS